MNESVSLVSLVILPFGEADHDTLYAVGPPPSITALHKRLTASGVPCSESIQRKPVFCACEACNRLVLMVAFRLAQYEGRNNAAAEMFEKLMQS